MVAIGRLFGHWDFKMLLAGLILLTVTLSYQVASAQTNQPPATFAYVTNYVSDNVSVIDTSTNMVIATIPVGDGPRRFAFSPDDTRAYVANELSNNVSVIDTLTSTEIDVDGDGTNGITRIPVGTRPMGIEVSPDGTAVYVANEGSDTMSVIETATNTVTATVSVAGGGFDTPRAPAFKPDGSEVWVSGGAENSIKRFAFPANTDLGTIGNVMGFATRIKFLPDGSFAFVQNPFVLPCSGDCGTGNLQKISTATNSVISTLNYGTNGHPGMAITPDGKFVYAGIGVGCSLCSQLLEVDTSTMTVTRRLTSIGAASGIAIPPDGNLLYVTTGLDNVLVIRRSDLAIITTIPVGGPGGSPTDIAITTLVVTVPIDIKPGSDPNCFNNNDKGVIPVAILGSANFDATKVDDSTVKLEGLAIKAVGKKGNLLSHIEDVNADGFSDLVVQIQDQDSTFQEGTTTATLTGNLKAEFGGTPIKGTDSICIVP